MHQRGMALGLGIVALVVACSGPNAPSNADVCTRAPEEARALLTPHVTANQSCTTDAECFTVPFSTSCFDGCTAVVNEIGKGALDRAVVLVEAKECKPFVEAKCPLIHPPCAPPAAPACRVGRCQ